MIRIIILGFIVWYIIGYSCIYTSYLTYNILDKTGFEAEYKKREMIGTPYFHYYVQSGNHELFLNPFRIYGKPENNIPVNELNQWGEFYNPISKKFVRIWNK